jgi:DNA replication initiation complex subunit (GINS family)
MYNELYKAWKSEQTSVQPEHLPTDFYRRAANYLKGLQEDSLPSDPHTLQSRLLIREREIVERLLGELREKRLRKILENAKNGISVPEDGLTVEEQPLVHTLNSSLPTFRERKLEGEGVSSTLEHTELTVVRFLQDIPEIVGTDLRIYGPYKKEDVGSLPTRNAQALIKQGAARPIDISGLSQVSEKENYPINNK